MSVKEAPAGTGIAEVRAAQAPRLSLKREIARYTEAARSYERSEANCNGIADLGGAVGRDNGNVGPEGEQRQPSPEGTRKGQRAKQATAEQQQ